jgi:hypothetical protein
VDQKQYEQLLDSVCEWHRPDPVLYLETQRRERLPKRPREPQPDVEQSLDPLAEDLGEEEHDEQLEQAFSDTRNPVNPESYPIRVKQFKNSATTCGDCGRHCSQGRKIESKVYKAEKAHWRTRCVNCNRYKNPFNGKYDVHTFGVVAIYNSFNRGCEIRPETFRKHCDSITER